MNLRAATVLCTGVLLMGGCDPDGLDPATADAAQDGASPSVASATQGIACASPTGLVINEFHLQMGEPKKSWVEVYNAGPGPFVYQNGNLSITFLTPTSYTQSHSYSFTTASEIPAGGYLLFCGSTDPVQNGGITGCTHALDLSAQTESVWQQIILTFQLPDLVPPDPFMSMWDQMVSIEGPGAFPSFGSVALRFPVLTSRETLSVPAQSDDPNAWTGEKWRLSTASIPGVSYRGTPGGPNVDVLAAPVACDDGNPCTTDQCVGGFCDNSQAVPGCCLQDTDCVAPDACTSVRCFANACVQTPVPGCCLNDLQCDDSNACTYNVCQGGQCAFPAIAGQCCTTDADCADLNPCTRDLCVQSTCQHQEDPGACCTDDAWCAARFDDGNACTTPTCVTDPLTQARSCQEVVNPTCVLPLPWVETFEGPSTMDQRGWSFVDAGTPAADHWAIGALGDMGPHAHLDFAWNPTVASVYSGALTPRLDAQTPQNGIFGGKPTTVQWRLRYRHALPGRPVTLAAFATTTSNVTDAPMWSLQTDEDVAYGLFSAQVPDAIRASPTLRVGFRVDTGLDNTAVMDGLEIDQVRVAVGVPNQLLRTFVLLCQDGKPCLSDTATRLETVEGAGPLPDVTLTTHERVRFLMCFLDPDASPDTWQYQGFPGSFLDGPPLDVPAFIRPAADVGQNNGCETLPFAVANVCGTGPEKGHFYCALDVDPRDDPMTAERYRTGLRTVDGWDADHRADTAFESLTTAYVNVLNPDGWVVWSPLDWEDPAALDLRDRIRATGRHAMVVKDLSVLRHPNDYTGIWAVLGVSGRYHEVTAGEATTLKSFLDAGKGLFLEGGDFFTAPAGVQAATVLHPYFKVRAVGAGVPKLAGPVTGRNFLQDWSFDVSQDAALNAGLDRIEHDPEQGGLEILRTEGAATFANWVAYADSYRTIGASLPFGALVQRSGGGTPDEVLARVLAFLEGDTPPCNSHDDCDDFESCTTDVCGLGGACDNHWRSGCVPCVDDLTRPSGLPACGLEQGCQVDLGYCVDVECGGVACHHREDGADLLPASLAAGHLELPLDVATSGLIQDVQVKVEVRASYRGALGLQVRAPDGTTVPLKAQDPADFGTDVNQTYDIGVALPAGSAMADFLEHEWQGTWTLVVDNADPYDTGWVEAWHLWFGKSPKCLNDGHCVDGNACTGDVCDAGYCTHPDISASCVDANPCTDDACDPATGCVHANDDTHHCNDGNYCNGTDVCLGGACLGSGTTDCNDSDACTDDSCVPATGCVHAPHSCDDLDACTTDLCIAPIGCSNTPVPPVDCVVGAWGAWGACSATCGGGTQERTRGVVTPASCGGAACAALTDTQACNTQDCCEANCDTCTDATTCTACAPGYTLSGGDCVADSCATLPTAQASISFGGNCWQLAPRGQTCNQFCADNGTTFNATGTRYVTGVNANVVTPLTASVYGVTPEPLPCGAGSNGPGMLNGDSANALLICPGISSGSWYYPANNESASPATPNGNEDWGAFGGGAMFCVCN